ncbi:hypothetical protein [Streptomyces sp. NPDC088757]|uniref:hypothetical protein n=1 Tax=Streptomyces sp. NPDC088757 TaxID=3365889 RepID=UPI003800C3A0
MTLTDKQLLTVADISEAELRVVRTAWVGISSHGEALTAATEAAALLAGDGGLAVIAGAPGLGKRTTGIKALWEAAQVIGGASDGLPSLVEISPDWSDPALPDVSVLPDESGTGYLLDVAAEVGTWKDARKFADALVSHAEKLRRNGSFLVLVADEWGWPQDESGTLAQVVVRTTVRPAAHQVTISHLRHVYRLPDRVHWVDPQPQNGGGRGELSDLLAMTSRPADAGRLAGILATVEASPKGREAARASFQEWRTQVTDVFDRTQSNADDRALLIAMVFLSGEEGLTIQDAARDLLGEEAEKDVRTILTGPDLTTRLSGVGAQVTGRRATLGHRPGYARSVLLHLWQQRADIHMPLLSWLNELTSPKRAGAARLAPISDLLVDLAIAENDIRVIEEIHKWIDKNDGADENLELIARILAAAAEADGLGPAVRSRLLDWSRENKSVAVARTIALVCQTSFADHYPRQALVRLRHILARTEHDAAVGTAETALASLASRNNQFGRVWAAVIKWAKESGHLAGHRAFLALMDPRTDPFALRVALTAATDDPEVKQALVDAWSTVLANAQVHSKARDVLIAWAHARVKDELVPRDLITDVLRSVVERHLMATPIAALVFGEPDVRYDEAVIELRKELHMPSPDAFVYGLSGEPSQ